MGSNKLGVFVLGGVVGAGLALLYAPRPGVETRAVVASKANETLDSVRDLGLVGECLCQEAADFYDDATALYEDALAQGAEALEYSAEVLADAQEETLVEIGNMSNELRAKIMEARDRIAAQVAKDQARLAEEACEAGCGCSVDSADAEACDCETQQEEACEEGCGCALHQEEEI